MKSLKVFNPTLGGRMQKQSLNKSLKRLLLYKISYNSIIKIKQFLYANLGVYIIIYYSTIMLVFMILKKNLLYKLHLAQIICLY